MISIFTRIGNLLRMGFAKHPETAWSATSNLLLGTETALYLMAPELGDRRFVVKRVAIVHDSAGTTDAHYTLQLQKGPSNIGNSLALLSGDKESVVELYRFTFPSQGSPGESVSLKDGEYLTIAVSATGTPTAACASVLMEGVIV